MSTIDADFEIIGILIGYSIVLAPLVFTVTNKVIAAAAKFTETGKASINNIAIRLKAPLTADLGTVGAAFPAVALVANIPLLESDSIATEAAVKGDCYDLSSC